MKQLEGLGGEGDLEGGGGIRMGVLRGKLCYKSYMLILRGIVMFVTFFSLTQEVVCLVPVKNNWLNTCFNWPHFKFLMQSRYKKTQKILK